MQFLETTFCITIVLLYNLYMPHTLIVCTLSLLLFLICKYFFYFFLFLCPKLVVQTKYIDTLIKLLLTYLLTLHQVKNDIIFWLHRALLKLKYSQSDDIM